MCLPPAPRSNPESYTPGHITVTFAYTETHGEYSTLMSPTTPSRSAGAGCSCSTGAVVPCVLALPPLLGLSRATLAHSHAPLAHSRVACLRTHSPLAPRRLHRFLVLVLVPVLLVLLVLLVLVLLVLLVLLLAFLVLLVLLFLDNFLDSPL